MDIEGEGLRFMRRAALDRQARNGVAEKGEPNLDLTRPFSNYGVGYAYFGFEVNIARYAVTQFAHQVGAVSVATPDRLDDGPTTLTLKTGLTERTKVYDNVALVFSDGCLMATYESQSKIYQVSIGAPTRERLTELCRLFDHTIEKANYYRGKRLRFSGLKVDFFERPSIGFDDVVCPEGILDDYRLNSVGFLTSAHTGGGIPFKRGILLSGPPGVGKTSLISATIRELDGSGVTCAVVSGDDYSPSRNTIQDLFTFVHDYLSPALIVFEDIDLIGLDRDLTGQSTVLGTLLSILNGVEETPKPMVVLASTNRPDVLDKALTRPCRFDRHFRFDYPGPEEVERLFQAIMGVRPPESVLDKRRITGAHIREIANTARLLALQNGGDVERHVEEAAEIVFRSFFVGQDVPIGIHGGMGDESE